MSKLFYILTHGNVDRDFYIKNISRLRERNVKMLKIAFTFGTIVNIALYCFALGTSLLGDLRLFYAGFTAWFVLWEILTFTVLDNHPHLAKLFYAVVAGSALTMAALAGTVYSKEMCAVIYPVFLIFVPGLYVNRPTCCVTTTVLSSLIFSMMVLHFKTDSYIITVDIINAVFCAVVGIAFNLYSINMQLENMQADVNLRELSTSDELTALPNRRSFNKRIGEDFERSKGGALSLIMMDLDFFKKYNDSYGYLKGDECIALVGKCLLETAKQYDVFVARYGGEEFVAVDYKNGEAMAPAIADAFVKNVAALQILHEESRYHFVTLSAGYATCPTSRAENYMQLINFADSALYSAKLEGRNCTAAHASV